MGKTENERHPSQTVLKKWLPNGIEIYQYNEGETRTRFRIRLRRPASADSLHL